MAQLLSPVCTDALRLHNPSLNICKRRSWKAMAKTGASWSLMGNGPNRRGCIRVKVATGDSASTDSLDDDYYAVLGLVIIASESVAKVLGKIHGGINIITNASSEEIKKAYYNCMKACHPDLSGNDPETTNFCMFINEVYAILSDPVQRMIYDEIHGYALTAINPFVDDSAPKDHVFVDEFSCIGCKNCANVAPDVFRIEEDFGRSRVQSQCGNAELVQQAIDSCPVDCIHWTSAAQLSLLEDEMRRVERVNVALMLSGMGSASVDVFRMANSRWEKRQAKVLEQAKKRMMRQKDSDKTDSYWSSPNEYKTSEDEVKERARRAAAAARRWREYSRRGVEKPPAFKLPNKQN